MTSRSCKSCEAGGHTHGQLHSDQLPCLPLRRSGDFEFPKQDDRVQSDNGNEDHQDARAKWREMKDKNHPNFTAFRQLSIDSAASTSPCSSKESNSTGSSSSLIFHEILYQRSQELFQNLTLQKEEECKEQPKQFYFYEEDIQFETKRDHEGAQENTRRLQNRRGGRSLQEKSVQSSSCSCSSGGGDSSLSQYLSRDEHTLPSLVSYHLSSLASSSNTSSGGGNDSISTHRSIVSSCSSSLVQSLWDILEHSADLDADEDEEYKEEDDSAMFVRTRSIPLDIDDDDTPKVIDCRTGVSQRHWERRANRMARKAARKKRQSDIDQAFKVKLPISAVGPTESQPPLTPTKQLRPILKRTEQEQSYTVRVDNRSTILRETQQQQKSPSSCSNRSCSRRNNRSARSATASTSRWDPI